MQLTSLSFIIFLLTAVLFYHLLPSRFGNAVLLVFSMLFYASLSLSSFPVILIYLWIVYMLGIAIKRSQKGASLFTAFGIIISVALLFICRYLNRYLELSLAVPLGISYITFRCISYLADLRSKKLISLYDPVQFLLYAMFFPKVTAGPIERPVDFLPQLTKRPILSEEDIFTGITRISTGFVKKIAVADLLAPGVETVFSSPLSADGLSAVTASVMYSFLILFDFSGYTDIAIGSASLFGIKLSENFDSPYTAVSVRNFWKRWHITLTKWLTGYIYIPLGGSKRGNARRLINILIVFLISGVWHGPTLNFVVWGALHGIAQVLEILFAPLGNKIIRAIGPGKRSLIWKVPAVISTFLLVTAAWVFFRADSVESALLLFKQMISPWAAPQVMISRCMPQITYLYVMIPAIIFSVFSDRFCRNKKGFLRTLFIAVISAWIVILAGAVSSGTQTGNNFIYFNF
ncbi:MAG: hypothetical protein K6C99_08360 [Lachnospiraceae bacterium]|nr:hypothetical protein [Lachnospiraceae bacterium]